MCVRVCLHLHVHCTCTCACVSPLSCNSVRVHGVCPLHPAIYAVLYFMYVESFAYKPLWLLFSVKSGSNYLHSRFFLIVKMAPICLTFLIPIPMLIRGFCSLPQSLLKTLAIFVTFSDYHLSAFIPEPSLQRFIWVTEWPNLSGTSTVWQT